MNSELRRNVSHTIFLAVLFFYISLLTGCGLVADGVNLARTIQLPAGDLYSPEFYQTATPEEVKRAIGSRSLENESFTERYYSSNTQGRGFLADLDGKVKTVQSVFIPMSSVDRNAPMYPLQVAVAHTPYPEVITILIDAGADPNKLHVAQYVSLPWSNPEISRILLARSSREARCESLIWLAERGKDMVMMDFCLGLEGAFASCSVRNGYPLKGALQYGQAAVADYLLERGAALPADPDGRLELLGLALRSEKAEAFWLLIEKGLLCSQVRSDGKNTLLTVAADAKSTDETVLLHLAKTIPLDAANAGEVWESACRTGNMRVLETLLKRNGGLPKDRTTTMEMLKTALEKKNGELFWKLVALGADCSQEDSSSGNNSMAVAFRNMRHETKIVEYLARHVAVKGEGGSAALRYAVRIGYAAPVRILLERGAVPDRQISIPEDAPEQEAVQAVLEEKGIDFRIR